MTITLDLVDLVLFSLLTLQRGREVREDRWLCNALHPFDVSGAVHVEAAEPEEDDSKDNGGENHPGTDSEDNSQDTDNCQTNLQLYVGVTFDS